MGGLYTPTKTRGGKMRENRLTRTMSPLDWVKTIHLMRKGFRKQSQYNPSGKKMEEKGR